MGKQFFVIKENADVLRLFHASLKNVSADELKDKFWILKPFFNIVGMMIEDPELFDKYSEANIEWIGDDMINRMRRFVKHSQEDRVGEIIIIFLLFISFYVSWSLWLPVFLCVLKHWKF